MSKVIVTTDGTDPVVVKTVAASTNYTPALPYVQTIEDGRGRAVFDGSAVKYLNGTWTGSMNTASTRFFTNAMNFLVRGGGSLVGKKILLLGDVAVSDAATGNVYSLKGTDIYSYYTWLSGACTALGLVATFKDRLDYAGGYLDPTYSELIQYDIIFLESMYYTPAMSRITDSGASNIAAARRAGVGVYIYTDHEVFVHTANAVVSKMTDAKFVGTYDFSPGTTVAYNRATYGDSPLFNNMLDTDIVVASTSDSMVSQATTAPVSLPVTINVPYGYTTIKVAKIDLAGNVTFEQHGYNVGQPPIIELCDPAGDTITKWPQTNLKHRYVYFKYLPGSFGNASGFIKVGDTIVAEFSNISSGVINATWLNTAYTSASVPNKITIADGSNPTISVELVMPVVFDYTWSMDRFIPAPAPTIRLGEWIQSLNKNEFATSTPSPTAVLDKAAALLTQHPPVQAVSISDRTKQLYIALITAP